MIEPPLNEEQIVADYKALRQVRRNNKKSIVRDDNGLFLTSVVYTDPKFAKKIIKYFEPQFKQTDTFLDPCKGTGAFFDNLPAAKDWCEIQDGKDFLAYDKKVDWIFANYPWRGKVYSAMSKKGFEVADNVVSLVKFSTAVGTHKRFVDANKNNMFIKEIIFTPWQPAGFTYPDGSVKSPEGFILSIIHWQRNYTGGTIWTDWFL